MRIGCSFLAQVCHLVHLGSSKDISVTFDVCITFNYSPFWVTSFWKKWIVSNFMMFILLVIIFYPRELFMVLIVLCPYTASPVIFIVIVWSCKAAKILPAHHMKASMTKWFLWAKLTIWIKKMGNFAWCQVLPT